MNVHGRSASPVVPWRRRPSAPVRRGVTLVTVIGAVVVPLLSGCGGKAGSGGSPATTAAGSPTAGGPAAASPGSGTRGTPGAAGTSPPQSLLPKGYQPLWPFANAAEVAAWQASYRSGGHQPWHLSADETALSFTKSFLGFKEVGKIVARSVSGSDARITVGYRTPENSRPAPAAVLHLIRAGSGRDAPWEVVGTDDRTLSLTTPAYGATVRSPVSVGGRITGVDESIQVRVLRAGAGSPLGSYCCLPAGGRDSPWSARVSFGGGAGRVLTVVAWTGGHVAEVERFAVTAIRG